MRRSLREWAELVFAVALLGVVAALLYWVAVSAPRGPAPVPSLGGPPILPLYGPDNPVHALPAADVQPYGPVGGCAHVSMPRAVSRACPGAGR